MAGHCQQTVDAISKSSIALRLLDEILDAVVGVTLCGQGWGERGCLFEDT
jgi:hypothetical protein